jgi:pre-mRNA-splicing helicase BRR2
LSIKLLNISKMAEKRLWQSQSPLRQFNNIPEMIVRKVEKSCDLSWSQFFDLKPQDLAEIVKIPKMGKTLHKFVHMLPRLELSANVLPITRTFLKVELKLSPDFIHDVAYLNNSVAFWILVYDVDGDNLLHHEQFMLSSRKVNADQFVTFFVTIADPIPPLYFIRVAADKWIGSDITVPVSFRDIILPSKFPPVTELLDLQPITLASLRNRTVMQLFPDVETLNPIQTQIFSTLYEGNSTVLLSAPSGCDKITTIELVMVKHFLERKSKCVYITPTPVISIVKSFSNLF